MNCKFFLIHRKWFCIRLLHLAPGPDTAQRIKNSLLSSRMDTICIYKGYQLPTQPQYVDMMASQCGLVILPQTHPNTQTPTQTQSFQLDEVLLD